jgi:hypothetical protein
MRMVELCRNFSRGRSKVRAVQKEKTAQADRNHRAEGEWIKRVGTDGLANAVVRCTEASPTEFETQAK